MEQRRLLNKSSLSELLEAAEGELPSSIVDESVLETDVSSFILYHEMEPGDGLAKQDLLYKLYVAYSNSPVNKISFNREFSLYFPLKNGYYLINKSASELISALSFLIKKRRKPIIKKRSVNAQFKAFLNHFSISKGEEWIEEQVLFHYFDKWLFNEGKKQAVSKDALIALMKIHFHNKKTKAGYVFNISSNFEKSTIESVRAAWKRKKTKDQK